MSTVKLQFKTELKQLLHLIIHSLYSHKDIFLRELISNASDAIDTARFQSLTNQDLLEGDSDWKIKLIADEQAGTLTISDNGIGMSRETVAEHLGTIAKSGTRAFLETLKQSNAEQRPELIGQFGVGFYSAFMVADKVTVRTRMAGPADAGVQWESDGQGEFTLQDITKDKRGTDVILHLKEDDKVFLKLWKLREIVKKYSDFVEHPIVMDVEKEGDDKTKTVTEETLNVRRAIWLRNKSQITQEEYDEFYKHLTHDQDKPLRTVHYSAEGQVEFKALLYIPSHRPFDLMFADSEKGLHLYIQRVFIMDDCEALLPRYLRFVRGVVDSPDLPLNVSREILQQSAPLEKIKSNLTTKILGTLEDLRKKDFEEYVKFYAEMGPFIKEGAYQDWTNRDKLADLLIFESNKLDAGKWTTFSEYVERMPQEQSEIWYLAGTQRDIMLQSPHLEAFKDKGWEVLLLTDPADEIVFESLRQYKGKTLKAVDRGGFDGAAIDEEKKKKLAPLLEAFKAELPDIQDARLSRRLKESAVCLVADENALSANMERLMARLGRGGELPAHKRILEVNPDHPVVTRLLTLACIDAKDPKLTSFLHLLYDQALITEGSKIKDPLAFAHRLNELILGA
jgi:molecular chaperone HtpG